MYVISLFFWSIVFILSAPKLFSSTASRRKIGVCGRISDCDESVDTYRLKQINWTKNLWAGNHISLFQYSNVMMSTIASQITGVSIVCLTVYSSVDRRKYQSSATLAFLRGIYHWPVEFPHKGSVTPKVFPFDDVIMQSRPTFMRTIINIVQVTHGWSTHIISHMTAGCGHFYAVDPPTKCLIVS